MADADRLVAALNYLQEQKPADPLESFRSLAGLKDAYERRVQPIINNAMQTFSTGGAMGDLLRSYGDAAAPGNAAALKGMGIPFKGPITAPREEGVSSGENFRPMGDPQQQFAGQLLGDPMNVQPIVAPAARGAVAAGKYAGPELARGLENYMAREGLLQSAIDWKSSPLVKMFPSGKSGHLADDVNMFVRELPNGKLEIERNLPWGVKANPFKMQGDNLEDLISAATTKASRSDTAKAAYETKKHGESLLGKLQETYGDNFTVSNSERSGSQYITHTPSGTKIRVSDHDLPLGYVQPDIDLRNGSTVADQLSEIMKTLNSNFAPQDEALRLAQQRAALPVEQHGLGLPAGNTPQQRAAAMGAEFGWGHGSNNPDITTFKPSRTGAQGPGIYATNYLPETNMYSSLKDTGNTSYPLAVFKDEALVSKLNNPYDELKVAADDELISELFKRNKSAIITTQEPTPDWLLKQGVSEYPERQHYVSVNPDNFRSRFAAFDPWRRNSALAAALGVAAPDLLAEENK